MATKPETPRQSNSSSDQVHTQPKETYHNERRRSSALRVANAGWKILFGFTSGKHYVGLSGAVGFSIVSGLISPAFAILLGKIFDEFTDFGGDKLPPSALRHDVARYSIFLASLGIASWLLNGGFFMSWLAFGELQAKVAHSRLFESLSTKSCAWYDTRPSGVGALVPRIHSQVRDFQLATSQPLGYVAQHTVTSIASLGIAFFYCWNLTLVIIATVPLTSLILVWISRRMQPSIEAQQQALSSASKSTTVAISNIDVVKCFNGQILETTKYGSIIADAAVHYLAQAKGNALQIGFVRFVTLAMFVQGFWYGHHLVESGDKTTGTVITTFWSCLTATQAVEEIMPHLMVLEKGRAAALALSYLLRKFTPNARTSSLTRPLTCRGEIEVHNVSFVYPARPSATVLSNFTGTFHPGRTTFLVGKSGSGKSTLAQILLGFYSAAAGTITIDGQLLQNIDPSWLRQNITLVEQHSVLFSGSIQENIRMGRSCGQPTIEDVKHAAQFGLLQHTVNDMASGLDTIVDARGGSLSGGQRQRIALARAWLRDTPLLILDEPTSALDQVSRSLIMAAIRKWRVGRTTVIVSHDMSQIEDDDYVYVLKDGRTVQQGSGKTLNLTNGSGLGGVRKRPIGYKHARNGPVAAIEARQRSLYSPSNQRPLHERVYSDPYDNIIDEYLDPPQSNSRKSYIPSIFARSGAGHGTSAGFMYNLQGQDPSQVSRPLQRSPTLGRQRSNTTAPKSIAISGPPTRSSRSKSDGKSEDLLQLVELTGKYAMDNRLSSIQRGRRGVESHYPDLQLPLDVQESSSLSMRQILRTVWPNLSSVQRLLLIIGFAGAVIHAITTPLFSWVFSKLLTTFFDPVHGARDATKWSLSIIGIAVADAIACFFMHILLEFCGQVWVDTIRKQALTRILDQSKHWFMETSNSSTGLIQSLDRDAEEMRNLLGRFAAFLLIALVMMSMSIMWSLAVCWKLTLVGLSIGPVSFAITRGFQSVSVHMEGRCNDASAVSASIMNETVTSIKTVRALTLEAHFSRRHNEAIQSALRIGLRRAFYSGVFFGLSEALIVFTNALIFYYGAVLASSREYSINQILLVFSMLLFSMANLSAIVAFIPQIQSSKDTATRLLRLANLPRTSTSMRARPSYPMTNSASGDSLPSIRTLTSINLEIRSGTCTAIVGPSGSGKSTIASLLLRLYPTPTTAPSRPNSDDAPTGAVITLNRTPLSTLSTPHLRGLISLVPQTTVLFPTTISNNITYPLPLSSPYTTTASIESAARAAGIHDYIASLPHGYETVVGDGGVGLSGGQMQRIGIARALVRRPRCLVLDESTSALDDESSALVRETVQSLVRDGREGKRGQRGGMTVLIITHERKMMEIADHVIMLDRGRVVEAGPFEELSNKRGGKLAGLLSGGVWDGGADAEDDGVGEHTTDTDDDGVYGSEGVHEQRDHDYDYGYEMPYEPAMNANGYELEDVDLGAIPKFGEPQWGR